MSSGGLGWMVILFGSVGVFSGLLLLKMGHWPRRRGSTPHCGECDYNLTGLTSDRCPECGQLLAARSIVRGDRHRRPTLVAVGWATLLVNVGFLGVQVGREADWHRVRPAGWLMSDLQSSNRVTAGKAWRELERRSRTGRLSASNRTTLTDLCLKEQAKEAGQPIHRGMIEYLGERYSTGALSEQQERTFFKQICLLELRVRPKVVLGDPIPIQVVRTCRGPDKLWVQLEGKREILVDGEGIDRQLRFSGKMRGVGSAGSTGTRISWGEPGRHTSAVTVPLKVYVGPDRPDDQAKPCHEADVPLEATFEVLETEPPNHIRLIDDPALKRELLQAIQPKQFIRESSGRRNIQIEFNVTNLPVNVAFEMIARIGDQEYLLTTVSMRKGMTSDYGMSSGTALPEDRFDLILRSSEKVARRTVDLFEIWQGQLVYEGLQVEVEQ